MGDLGLDTEEDILKELRRVLKLTQFSSYVSGITAQRIQKLTACETDENELKQIYYLINSHVESLKRKTVLYYERLSEECTDDEMASELRLLKSTFETKPFSQENVEILLKQINEMPKEWTLIQLTSQYNYKEDQNIDLNKRYINAIDLTVINCGQTEIKPFVITLQDPIFAKDKIGLIDEFLTLIVDYEKEIRNLAKSKAKKLDYLSRERTQFSIKSVLNKIEIEWLKEWKCLFQGKYQDNKIETKLDAEIDQYLLEKYETSQFINRKQKYILKQLVKSLQHLGEDEIKNMIKYCLDDCNEMMIKDLYYFAKLLNFEIHSNYDNFMTNPIILIIDEGLDVIPWEMIKMLKCESISRLPSFHFAYMLFKTYEQTIENGYKIIKNYQNGMYVTDPDGNLENMQKRMVNFYNYWIPSWKGIVGVQPSEEEFFQALTNSEIFVYNGHGSGAHFISLDSIQKMKVAAVVCLFGCNSIQVKKLGPQVETYSTHYFYLVAKCPCLLGMLYSVTDGDVDMLTAEFFSNWIPSECSLPWSNIDKKQWKRGVLPKDCILNKKSDEVHTIVEELGRALNNAKQYTKFFTTKAACIVRGLPVKIQY